MANACCCRLDDQDGELGGDLVEAELGGGGGVLGLEPGERARRGGGGGGEALPEHILRGPITPSPECG